MPKTGISLVPQCDNSRNTVPTEGRWCTSVVLQLLIVVETLQSASGGGFFGAAAVSFANASDEPTIVMLAKRYAENTLQQDR